MGILESISQFVGGGVNEEVERRLEELDDFIPAQGTEYDAFGACKDDMRKLYRYLWLLYKIYFRVEVEGIENVASLDKALITPNHMTLMPVDGACITAAMFFEPEKPRMVHTIVHHFLATNPFASSMIYRTGQVIGNAGNADRLFEGDNMIVIFPEGAGAIRPYYRRYRLNRFSPGFMEYAIRYNYPIVPTAVIGSEESIMTLGESKKLRRLTGLPRFPITPTFPLFGPLGAVPYPVKFRIFFGEPMYFGEYKDRLEEPIKIRLLVEEVRVRVQKMLEKHLSELPPLAFLT